MSTLKKVIICADDFGQSQSISQGIVELCQQNKLSASSCMTNVTNWPKHALLLEPLKNIDKGVHINFTHGKPFNPLIRNKINHWPNSLLRLISWLIAGQLTLDNIKLEIEAQLMEFEAHTNQIPDFIDGHQHIHHFPMIRWALLDIYEKKYQNLPFNKKPYLRISSCRPKLNEAFWFKKKLIQWFGSETLKQILINKQIPFNRHFCGVYPFNHRLKYEDIITTIFSNIKNNSLLMCHPAMNMQDRSDPIAKSRLQEYKFFLSKAFDELLIENKVRISRFDRNQIKAL